MRKMKKIIAFLVAVFVFTGNFSCLVTHAQETAWGDITSVTAEAVDNEYYEGTNGYYNFRDVNGASEPFYYYNVPEYEFTVNYVDGSFEVYNSNALYNFYSKYGTESLVNDNGKQYEKPWDVGKHAFQLTILGYQLELEVTILARPFESFTVIPSYTSVKENTHGSINQTWNSVMQETVSYWQYSEPSYQYVFLYENGKRESLNWWEVSQKFGITPESDFYSIQRTQPFQVGENVVTITYMGLTSSYNFTVIPFSPKMVEVIPKNNVYMEGTNGCFSQRYNSETQQYESFWEYYAPDYDIKMTFEDDTQQVYSRYEYSQEFGYSSCNSGQYNAPWGIGEHYFTVDILNSTHQLPVTITETNIAKAEVISETTEYVKNTNGSWSGSEWMYNVPDFKLKVTYKDGSTTTISDIQITSLSHKVEGDTCIFNLVVNHTYKAELSIALIESPVSSIEVLELERVSENNINPVSGKLKINYKDGTSKIAMLNPVATDKWNQFVEYSYGGYPITVSVGADLKVEIDYLGAKTEYQLAITGEDAFSYFEQEGQAFIYAYKGAIPEDGVLTIPNTLGGLPVVGITDMIGNQQLAGITEIVVPDSVISISDSAISRFNNLKTLRLGSGIRYLDEYSFGFNNLLENIYISNELYKDIDGVVYTANGEILVNYPSGRPDVYTIPSGVLNFDALPEDVRFELTDDGTLTVVDGVTYTADMKAVVSCDTEKSGEYIMPDTVTSIYKYAFSDCTKLESVKISDNVTDIVYGAFTNCSSLKAVDLPVSLKKIYWGAFDGTDALDKVVIHDVAAWCNVEIGSNPISTAGNVYLDDELITDLVIPEGVTEVKSSVFSGASCVKTLTLPTSLTSIGYDAFSQMELDKITISDMAKWCEINFEYNPIWIANEVYLNEELIIDLVIPEGVTRITNDAFTKLPEHIKTLTIPSTIKEIGSSFTTYSYTWAPTPILEFEKVYLTDLAAWCEMDRLDCSLMRIAKTLYVNNELVKELVIPEGVKTVIEGAFDGCKVIESVSFPSTIEKVGSLAFQDTSIKSYSFAEGVGHVEYGYRTFGGTALLETNLGSETTRISEGMFEGSDITIATIPATVTEIAYEAFKGCKDLVDISAPETLISIRAYAFDETKWYETKEDGLVYLGNNLYKYKGIVEDNTIVEVREGTLSIAEAAFENASSEIEIKLPDSLRLIGNYAFGGSGIRTITIPKNVEMIGNMAFTDCDSLSEINVSPENSYYSSVDGILYNKDVTELIQCPEGKTGKILIPKTVEKIRSGAFNNVGDISLEIENPDVILEKYSIGYSETFYYGNEYYGSSDCHWTGNNDIELIAKENSKAHQYAKDNYLNFTPMKMESVSGYSVSLHGDIAVNFYMKLSDEIIQDTTAYMEFTMPNGRVSKVMIGDAKVDAGSGNYVFSCDVSAAEMADTIKAQIITSAGETQEYTYTVKTYADYILAHTDVAEYAKAAPLVKAMLNYGGYSQKQFNHNTSVMANAGLYDEATDPVLTENVTIDDKYTFNAPKDDIGLKYYGSSLLLNSNTTVRHYFTITGEETFSDVKENYTFTISDGTVLTPKMNNGMVCVDIVDIKAAELDNMFTMTVTKGTKSFDVTYSPFSYAKYVLEYSLSKENLTNVIKAMYLYNKAANTYFD